MEKIFLVDQRSSFRSIGCNLTCQEMENKLASRPEIDLPSSMTLDKPYHLSQWSKLPHELLELISKGLPLDGVLRLATVCKCWNCITGNPRRYGRPCFMYLKGDEEDETTTTFFDSLSQRNLHLRVPSCFQTSCVLYSKDGWVLMAEILKTERSMLPYFINPLTKVRIDLPEVEGILPWGFSFSGKPTSSDCIVVAIQHLSCWSALINWCRRGEDQWEERLEESEVPFVGQHTTPVYHHGRFYAVGGDGSISVFNFERNDDDDDDDDDHRIWTVLPKPNVFDVGETEVLFRDEVAGYEIVTGKKSVYLVESDEDELLLVLADVEDFSIVDVQIYKLMDLESNEWEEINEIGGNLYLGRYSCIFAKETREELIDRVYLNIFKGQDCVSYVLGGDSDDEVCPSRLVGMNKFLRGFWIDFDLSYPSVEELSW